MKSALRGEADRKTLVVPWRRPSRRDGDGSPIGRARFFARPAGTQPFMLHAGFCVVPGEVQESGPELQGVLETDSLRGRYDPHRRFMPAIRTRHHDAQDRRLSLSSAVPNCTPPPRHCAGADWSTANSRSQPKVCGLSNAPPGAVVLRSSDADMVVGDRPCPFRYISHLSRVRIVGVEALSDVIPVEGTDITRGNPCLHP
jgi:hypothetical protein